MSTDFSTKCRILADVHSEATWNKDLDEFRQYNDMGLPLAYAVAVDIVEPKEKAKEFIEETWILLCKLLEVDPDKEYEDSEDILSEAGIEIDEDDEDA